MYTIDGNINDARNGGAGTTRSTSSARRSTSTPTTTSSPNGFGGPNTSASIGIRDRRNDVEIDSSRGWRSRTSASRPTTRSSSPRPTRRSSTSFNVTDAVAARHVPVARGRRRSARCAWCSPGVDRRHPAHRAGRGRAAEDDDLNLLHSGNFQRAEDDLLTIPNGTIIARLGFVLLRVGDDVDLHQNSRTWPASRSTSTATPTPPALGAGRARPRLRHRHGAARPDHRRLHQRRGDLDVHSDPTPTARSPVGDLHLTEIWGYDDIDHIQFGDPTGIPTRRSTRRRRSATPATSSSARRRSPAAATTRSPPATPATTRRSPTARTCSPSATCSRRTCSPRRRSSPTTLDARRRPQLTLDGQADTDYYTVYTTGSRVLGAQLRHQRARHRRRERRRRRARDLRRRQRRPGFNGYVSRARRRATRTTTSSCCARSSASTPTAPYGVDDARRRPDDLHVADRGRRPARRSSPCSRRRATRLPRAASSATSRPTTSSGSTTTPRSTAGSASTATAATTHFYVDDNSAITTLDGGAGYDMFQIGQIFGTKRDEDGIPTRLEPTTAARCCRTTCSRR